MQNNGQILFMRGGKSAICVCCWGISICRSISHERERERRGKTRSATIQHCCKIALATLANNRGEKKKMDDGRLGPLSLSN